MEVEFTSDELRLEAGTVPSSSEHEFLVEGIMSRHHRLVTEVQIKIHDYMQEILGELEEARKQKTLGVNHQEQALKNKLTQARGWRDKAITSIEQGTEENLKSLEVWEASH